MPGDPVELMISSNPNIRAEDVARLRELYGLDQPFYKRYGSWLSSLLQGDLGYSRTYKIPVVNLIGDRLLNTFFLSLFALGVSLLAAIPIGTLCAVYRNQLVDKVLNFLSVTTLSLPSFWLGLMLIILFSVQLKWLPAGGTFYTQDGLNWSALVLPLFSLAIMQTGVFVKYVRSSMIEALTGDYVRTAKAKGLGPWPVYFHHALKNALIPLITVVALSFSSLFSGAIITETVFSYLGIGKLVFDSIQSNDFNVAMISFLISIFMVLLMSLVADVLYSFADPRVSVQ